MRAWACTSASSSTIPPREPVSSKVLHFHRITTVQQSLNSFCVRLTVHIDNGQVGARNDHPLAHHQPQAPRAAGDDADVALQREGRQGRVDVQACTAGADDGARIGELVVLWVLDRDTIIGAGEGAGVGGLALVPVASLGTLPRLLHVGADLVVFDGEEGGGDGGSWGCCWSPADGSQGCACSSGEGGHCGVSAVDRWIWVGM